MSNDFSKHQFTACSDTQPCDEDGTVFWASGITATSAEDTFWIDRIQCYGKTQEEAQGLRDLVLRGLEKVAEEEREEEASRRSSEALASLGLISHGTANIGSQVISAGLGSKDDD